MPPTEPDTKDATRWHRSMIPLYMAIGNPGLLVTLVALSQGASVAEVGVISSAGSMASFLMSMFWGRLSDASAQRKKFLLAFSLILVPIFVGLSLANGAAQITLLYTLVIAVSSGVAPVAVMYTVECCRGKNWSKEVAKFNSIMSIGNILGLLTCTFAAEFYPTQTLFYISSAVCLIAATMLWRLGEEPTITLERHSFHPKILHHIEGILSPKPILQYLDLRKLKLHLNPKQIGQTQLLMLAAFVHWLGINIYAVGMTPLMKAIGMSDSLILALNVVCGLSAAASFIWLTPRIKAGHKHVNKVIILRTALVLCWIPLPLFIANPWSYAFIFPLLFNAAINVLYAVLWLPLTSLAIQQAPEDAKSSAIAQLISATAIAGAIGSAAGGIIITTYGYTVGFLMAGVVMLLAVPIISRINAFDTQ